LEKLEKSTINGHFPVRFLYVYQAGWVGNPKIADLRLVKPTDDPMPLGQPHCFVLAPQ